MAFNEVLFNVCVWPLTKRTPHTPYLNSPPGQLNKDVTLLKVHAFMYFAEVLPNIINYGWTQGKPLHVLKKNTK